MSFHIAKLAFAMVKYVEVVGKHIPLADKTTIFNQHEDEDGYSLRLAHEIQSGLKARQVNDMTIEDKVDFNSKDAVLFSCLTEATNIGVQVTGVCVGPLAPAPTLFIGLIAQGYPTVLSVEYTDINDSYTYAMSLGSSLGFFDIPRNTSDERVIQMIIRMNGTIETSSKEAADSLIRSIMSKA